MSTSSTGPRVVAALAVAGVFGGVAALGIDGSGEAGIRLAIRVTARIGAVLFSIVFATSALNSLFRAAWTKWLLRNRRYMGNGFAAVHIIHLAFVFVLAFAHADSFFATTAMASMVGGGIGYLIMFAMMGTSTDRAAKAMGRKAWLALHKSGMYLLWLIFVYSYIARVFAAPIYTALVALLVLAYVARLAAFARKLIRGAQRSTGAQRPA